MNTGPTRATIVAAIIALLGGIALVVVGVTHVVRDVVHTINAPAYELPADLHRQLGPGDYDIYQQTGTRTGGGGFTFGRTEPLTLTPADVRVTGPDGSAVGVSTPGATETLSRGSADYTAAVRFTVLQSGNYEIQVQRPFGGGGGNIIVTKSFGTVARSAVRWVLLVIAGGMIALIGLVLLIVVLVRSRRRPTTTPAPAFAGVAPAAAPPGWYPDPSGQASHRWWDGARWTDHIG